MIQLVKTWLKLDQKRKKKMNDSEELRKIVLEIFETDKSITKYWALWHGGYRN